MRRIWDKIRAPFRRRSHNDTSTSTENSIPESNLGQKTSSAAAIDLLPWSYAGLIDDVMLRYTRDFISEQFFKRVLAKNVFFGGGILLNDGYITQHPVARRYLMNDRGILRSMLRTNFAKILTRQQSGEALAEMPYTMAKSGSESYERLIRSEAWINFEPYFRDIAMISFNRGNARPWPKRDMSVGFVRLMSNALAKKTRPADIGIIAATTEDLSRLEENFMNRSPERKNPRDQFERAAREVFQGKPESDFREAMREVMDVANQCYHYNFGLALTAADLGGARSSDNNVTVDTTVGPAFDELLELSNVLDGDLESIPILSVPHEFPDDMGYKFDMFFDFASPVGKAKLLYLTSLRNVLSSPEDQADARIDEVRRVTREYQNEIRDYFKREFNADTTTLDQMFDRPIQLGFGTGSGQHRDADGRVRVAGGPLGQVAIRILDDAKNYSRDILLRRFRLSTERKKYNFEEGAEVRLGDIRPQITSLAFDPAAAEAHVERMPVFAAPS